MTVISIYDGDTVLHYAASRKDLLDFLKSMIDCHHCNLLATNKQGHDYSSLCYGTH